MQDDQHYNQERFAKVYSILADTHEALRLLKDERDNPVRGLESRTDANVRIGEIRAYSMVIDAFAEAGFDVRKDAN